MPAVEAEHQHPGVHENKALQDELAKVRAENYDLKNQLEDAQVLLEVQKSTLHEGHLRNAEIARIKYAALEDKYKQDMADASVSLSEAVQELNASRQRLEEERRGNADLVWRMERLQEELDASRDFAVKSVHQNLRSMGNVIKVYSDGGKSGAFRLWARSVEAMKLVRLLHERDMEIKLLKYKGGVDMLSAVFRKWMNSGKYSAWNQWMACVHETRQEQALARLLDAMTLEQRAAALKRLQYIISAWTGQMQHLAFLDWMQIVKTAKDVRHRADLGARKLIRQRMWRGMRGWAVFTYWSRKSRWEASIADLRTQCQILEEERDRYMRRLDSLMEKFLASRQGEFFSRCDRMLKAWKFGTIALMFSDWGKFAKQSARARALENGQAELQDVQTRLQEALKELAALQHQLSDKNSDIRRLEQDAAHTQDEIAQLKIKLQAAIDKQPVERQEGYDEAVKEYERRMDEMATRLLSKIHAGFADKVERIMKAWKFGTVSLFFSDWGRMARKDPAKGQVADLVTKVATLSAELDSERHRSAELAAELQKLQHQLDDLRRESAEENLRLKRQLEDLQEELDRVNALLTAATEGRKRDVLYEQELAASALAAAEDRIAKLQRENVESVSYTHLTLPTKRIV
eukprot:TRINITY_DN1199_c0_g1_i4.p1 TRINITY_DN1199_c0_g1~~TRINITY_DN1199_c0_g1_i4.p1  ORF type:complete len:633 (+),score=215.27 TRINITY_DN1199_c0_g1_i4:52-1950(+)